MGTLNIYKLGTQVCYVITCNLITHVLHLQNSLRLSESLVPHITLKKNGYTDILS